MSWDAVRERQPGEGLSQQATGAHQGAQPDLAAVGAKPAARERGDGEHERTEVPVQQVLRLVRACQPLFAQHFQAERADAVRQEGDEHQAQPRPGIAAHEA